MEKRERGSNMIFPKILRLFGKISIGEEDGNFGEENHDLKNRGWGRIASLRDFNSPPYYKLSRLLNSMI